jgi:Zn-dependent metalloprotease
MGGFSWEKIGSTWYAALTNRKLMKPHSDFVDAATATMKSATTLFGANGLEVKAIEKGWKTAGVI